MCDNSCEFANDGVCDDGTAASGKQRQRVKEEGDWEDDIYGNYFYGEDGGDNDDDFHEYDDDYYGAGYDYYNYGYGDDDVDPKSSVQMKKLAVTPDTTYSGSA